MIQDSAKWRILYIEDDVALARLVQKTLARAGILVETAADGDAGLQKLATIRFDAVALDHHLPDRDGLEIIGLIQDDIMAPPVIYVTANEDARTAVAALKAGAADYVVKTVGSEFLELLRAALIGAIDRAELRRRKLESERALREAHDHARDLAEQRAILVHEVNHRVANSLQLIVAMLHLQEAAASDPAVTVALANVGQRIAAVAGVHRRLYTADDVRTVALAEYLEGLVGELVSSMANADSLQVEVSACPISIATDKAVRLGLIVNELVTNAIKYAYPAGASGVIRVKLQTDGDRWAALLVEDDGIGFVAGTAGGTGLGQRIVGTMARALGGRMTNEPAPRGTIIRISFPV